MPAVSEAAKLPADDLVLARDVFFCVTEGQGVFLDLKQDSYCAIPIPDLGESPDNAERVIRTAFAEHRKDLLDSNVVAVGEPERGGLLAYRSIPRLALSIFHPDDERAFGLGGVQDANVRIRTRDVLDVFAASSRASFLLRKQHIHAIVGSVRSRKARAPLHPLDTERLKNSIAIFRKLRPWYPRRYLCLFDALALVEFLARRGFYPDWVFGVQAQPFGAHCWLQAGDHLLNEGAEFAGQFTPIMKV